MTDDERRAAAISQIKQKRDFGAHLATYVIINGFFIAIWALTDSASFWPIWVMVPWGLALAFHGWNAYFNRPITEEDISKELGDTD
jgi:2TM domain